MRSSGQLWLTRSALLGTVVAFAIHYHQDHHYWKVLDQLFQQEQQGRADCLRAQRPPTADVQQANQRLLRPRDAPDKPGLKVFVYDLPEEYNSALVKDQPRCRSDQYGTEVHFHESILLSSFNTRNPKEADFFFVPIYGECYLFRATQRLGANEGLADTNRWYRAALDALIADHPHWNRTQARDHLFVFAGARGAQIFQDWKLYIKKAVFLTPEGDRSLAEQFNTWKDVVIPGLEIDRRFWAGEGRGNTQRDIFAFFKGTIQHKEGRTYSRGLRPVLQQQLKGHRDVIFATRKADCDRGCYHDEMVRSVFCLCPRGWSPWTLRAYQAMMLGCIPVLIADEIELPYERTLDWSELTVKIAESEVNQTLAVLRAIPRAAIEAKQQAISRVWKMMTYPTPAEPGDAFYSVMADLSAKVRRFKASSLTTW